MADKKEAPKRPQSVPVEMVRFVRSMSVPGVISTKNSITDKKLKKNSPRHRIEYHPTIRSFKISFFPAGAERGRHAFVPDSSVLAWMPFE